MKFKCSFTNKKVEHPNDMITIVTLEGFIPCNSTFMRLIPKPTWEWLKKVQNVDWDEKFYPSGFKVIVTGKARRYKDDTSDDKKGEMVAECKAKKTLYKFCHDLLLHMAKYYTALVNGTDKKNKKGEKYDFGLMGEMARYNTLHQREAIHFEELR